VTDEQRSGRPSTSAGLVPAIEETVPANCRVLLKELEEQSNLSHGTIWDIVRDRSGYRKVCSRWGPRQLTEDHNKTHMGVSLTHLFHFNDHGEDFLEQIITRDETWDFHLFPNTKKLLHASDSNHMMMSSMRCKHGCVVRIPPSIDRVLRNGFPA